MDPVHCAICEKRVSDWMMACGKTLIIDGQIVHKACVEDYRVKTGKNYVPDEAR
ncbi:MAG TPA: hypothetical protein VFX17_02070 [Patescibacteria group bacterium]|nr:hypothetical protein [Patescibacteria group bacterium]